MYVCIYNEGRKAGSRGLCLKFVVGHFLERIVAAGIEDVVLQHEEHVEHDADEAKAELGEVPEQRRPVIIIIGDDEHLQHAQGSTSEVEEYVPDAPAYRRFSPEVENGLRDVLHQRDDELAVGKVVEVEEPGAAPVAARSERYHAVEHCASPDDAQKYPSRQGHALVLPLVEEALEHRDERGQRGVQAEHNVVHLDWQHSRWVARVVFALNYGTAVDAKVEEGVRQETRQVEADEVEAQADHTSALPVEVYLRIEGDRPGDEVEPAKYCAQDVEPAQTEDADAHEGVAGIDVRQRRVEVDYGVAGLPRGQVEPKATLGPWCNRVTTRRVGQQKVLALGRNQAHPQRLVQRWVQKDLKSRRISKFPF